MVEQGIVLPEEQEQGIENVYYDVENGDRKYAVIDGCFREYPLTFGCYFKK